MGKRQVCELTPGGRGAICVLQLRGDNVSEIVQDCFFAAGKRPLTEYPLLRPVYGYWQGTVEPVGREKENSELESGEDVVICRMSPNEMEVHCHGGEFAKRRIIKSLVQLEFEVVAWRDWVESNELSPIAIAASRMLARTQTTKTASVLNWQLAGALDHVLAEIRLSLHTGRIEQASRAIDSLLAWEFLVPHLDEPWQVAIAGPPNVGKSSLMNRLVGFERSIVFNQPGTTRDLVSALTAINGWPVNLIDTAGLRETGQAIESMGIDLARQALQSADLIISVHDVSSFDSTLSQVETDTVGTKPVLKVLNKVDLLVDSLPDDRSESIYVSAVTGYGIKHLIEAIACRIVPLEPEFQQAIPFLDHQVAVLRQARSSIESEELQIALASIEGLLIPN